MHFPSPNTKTYVLQAIGHMHFLSPYAMYQKKLWQFSSPSLHPSATCTVLILFSAWKLCYCLDIPFSLPSKVFAYLRFWLLSLTFSTGSIVFLSVISSHASREARKQELWLLLNSRWCNQFKGICCIHTFDSTPGYRSDWYSFLSSCRYFSRKQIAPVTS